MSKTALRLSLKRSVSFLKNSIPRTNSTGTVTSTDESSSFDTRSTVGYCNEIFVLKTDTNRQRRRSCMKGSRPLQHSKNLRVQFKRSINKIRMIEPYFKYASDLWYSEEEKKDVVSKLGFATETDSLNARLYVKYYLEALMQVYPTSYIVGTTDPIPARPALLSKHLFNEIVQGRVSGYAGLEQYNETVRRSRRLHIKNTVLAIVSEYYECRSTKDADVETSKKVRSYSKSVTAIDRSWAAAIGQADADAAARVYESQ